MNSIFQGKTSPARGERKRPEPPSREISFVPGGTRLLRARRCPTTEVVGYFLSTCRAKALSVSLSVPGLRLLVLAVALGGTLSAFSLEIQLPAETGAFKQDVGAEIANGQCLTCHSVEYVTMQPPMPRAFWKSSV